MKHFLKLIFFIFCLYSSIELSAAQASNSNQVKLYFDSYDVEITENVIYIHLKNNLIETNVLRTDQQGFYIFEGDITNYKVERERKWKCPYCYHWWPIGEKCQNPECPTNKW